MKESNREFPHRWIGNLRKKQNETINHLQVCYKLLKRNFQILFIILGKIFGYFWVTLYTDMYVLTVLLKPCFTSIVVYASQNALRFRRIKTNNETQLKIHFQPFISIAHKLSELFCVILYRKHVFVRLNDTY